jgi:carbonic anhydrase
MQNFFKSWQKDLPASLVVFLVALPLCLGVGLASTTVPGIEGLPSPFSGIIAGIIGGVVVGFFSGSKIGVSGPAAGLITIVLGGITVLGSYQGFLLALVIAGIIQIIASILKLGVIANYFPSAVIKGMLASIGIILILKEIPHLIGYDKDFMGDEAFVQNDGHNTFSELYYAIESLNLGIVLIGMISMILLLVFDLPFIKKFKIFKFIPGALFAVVLAILINQIYVSFLPELTVQGEHLVQLPVMGNPADILNLFIYPDLSFLSNSNTYILAFTLAIVGSLETLLSVEATDKLDPDKNTTPTNQELRAQGIGNIVSGLIGGLPVTQVIVRSSANVTAGAKSKLSTIIHGLLLLMSVLFLAPFLNKIPLAVLAAILILVGYKLTKISLFKEQFNNGLDQFIPFIATIIGVLFTDLLIGICIGIIFSIFFILRKNFKNNFKKAEIGKNISITLSEEVSFLNKAGIKEELIKVPSNSILTIDASHCKHIDYDVIELIKEFKEMKAKLKNIQVDLINFETKI